MKSLMRYRGLMVLVLWQAAPIGTDEYGRTRFGFGVGAGSLEYTTIGCDGSVLEDDAAPYKSAGAEVEHWIAPGKVRVHASVGHQWSDSITSNGAFGGVMLAYEGKRFGIGAGISVVPASTWYFPAPDEFRPRSKSEVDGVPNMYLRIGNRDRAHFRMDAFAPGVNSPSEVARLGVGFNAFNDRKASGFVGLAGIVASLEEEGSTGFVGEFFRPISPSVAFGVHAFATPGRRNAHAGLTTRLRITTR